MNMKTKFIVIEGCDLIERVTQKLSELKNNYMIEFNRP